MRTKNSFLNFLANSGSYIINLILSFIARTIFIDVFSQSYLGINGLFGNILAVLSLAELGIGSAMVFHLYKPIAQEDETAITAMMNLYRRLYMIVALVVTLLGLLLVPFLDIFVKDAGDIEHITLIYLLYLASTVSSYLWGYKRAIIDGHQKAYICTIYSTVFTTIQFLLQIVVLLKFQNFILYLLIQIGCTIMTNLVLAYQAEKMYPYLKCDRKSLPSKETRKSIYKNAGAMSIHKLGDVMLNNTDSLIMSSFVGVGSVGIYSNYLLISNSVNTALSSILGATTASIGNLSATEDRESVFRVYKVLQFLCFWIYSFSCVAFMILYNPFISAWTAWTGKDYLFPMTIVFVYVLNFYINGMRKGILIFRDAMGLYWYDRYKPIFEVIINLVFSIVLVIKMGIVGIMFGTFISVMSTCFWVEPLVTYKYGFHKKVSHYFILFAKYTAVMFIAGGFTYWVCSFFDMGGYKEVLIKGILCTLLYNVILLLLYFRTDEFREIWKIMKNLMHNYRAKKGRA